ncbi:MAG: hypothetical protein LM600_00985 [Thaumarchaeota archaeon]|nr:hypothetical protein [Nitrososphaerota archaeon]
MKARRITFRERRVRGRPWEYAYFYETGISRSMLSVRLRRDIASDIIGSLGFNTSISWSKSGKTLVLGEGGEALFRLLAILASLNHCSKRPIPTAVLVGVFREMGEYAMLFWYSEITKRYEWEGVRGVCRVVRAFRTLYGI